MKILLISHIADLDGVMPVVLTDLVFEDYDYKLLDIKDVDNYILDGLKKSLFDNYDKVIMTDLCVSEEVANKIDSIDFKKKFLVLDHHIGNIELNKYSFITVIDEVNGIKESGTSLYYKYLLENFCNDLIKRNSVAYMVSLVRLGDTWQWKNFNVEEARDISTILSYYGNDRFINNYTNFLRKNREFYFNEAEKVLIESDKNMRHDYIERAKENMIIRNIKGYKVGIVFAELYRSELGNTLAEYFIDSVDLIMIINMNRTFSFRCVKDNVDVCEFAKLFGGKGHKKAAGAPLPENLKEDTIDYILRGIK